MFVCSPCRSFLWGLFVLHLLRQITNPNPFDPLETLSVFLFGWRQSCQKRDMARLLVRTKAESDFWKRWEDLQSLGHIVKTFQVRFHLLCRMKGLWIMRCKWRSVRSMWKLMQCSLSLLIDQLLLIQPLGLFPLGLPSDKNLYSTWL